MSIILFIVILVVLIFIHELGHFLVAKLFGIRVDEFGFGYPPRIAGWRPKNSETMYSINWLPFGGFVKIFGEDPSDPELETGDASRSFTQVRKLKQIGVLVAGVFFNFIFAWLLFAIVFMAGVPTTTDQPVGDEPITITSVLADSPAARAGIEVGDKIAGFVSLDEFRETIQESSSMLSLEVIRGETALDIEVEAEAGITEDGPAIGVAMAYVTVQKMNVFEAVYRSLIRSATMVGEIVVGFAALITGGISLDQVAGPVGIVGLVSDASALGALYLLIFTAFISLNLAVLNLIPFPALDGGRILFVLIEKIKGSPIKPKIAQSVNMVGFGLLILVMIIVTFNDVLRLL